MDTVLELKMYLLKKDIRVSAFADMVGYDKCYISGILNRKKIPGRKLKKKIEQVTEGEVTYSCPHEHHVEENEHCTV